MIYDPVPDDRAPYTLEELRSEIQIGASELDLSEGLSLEEVQRNLALKMPPPNFGVARGL